MKINVLNLEHAGLTLKSHSFWNAVNLALSNLRMTFFFLQTYSQSVGLLTMADLLCPTNSRAFYPVTKHWRHKLSPWTQTPNHTHMSCSLLQPRLTLRSSWLKAGQNRASLGLGVASSCTSICFSRRALVAPVFPPLVTLSPSLQLAEIWIRELTWNKNNLTERKTRKGGFCTFFVLNWDNSLAGPSHSHAKGTTGWERGTVQVQERSAIARRKWLRSRNALQLKRNTCETKSFTVLSLPQFGAICFALETWEPVHFWPRAFHKAKSPLGCPLARRDHCTAIPPHSWVRLRLLWIKTTRKSQLKK